MLLAPLIHGAAQWALFNIMTMGGRIIMPDTVDTLRPDEVLRLVEAEKVFNLPVVGDAMARPLIDEIERGDYDLVTVHGQQRWRQRFPACANGSVPQSRAFSSSTSWGHRRAACK